MKLQETKTDSKQKTHTHKYQQQQKTDIHLALVRQIGRGLGTERWEEGRERERGIYTHT